MELLVDDVVVRLFLTPSFPSSVTCIDVIEAPVVVVFAESFLLFLPAIDCRLLENAITSSTALAHAMTALDARSESPFATASATSAALAAALAPMVGLDCLAMCSAVAVATAAATAVAATLLIWDSSLMAEYCLTISENCSKGFFSKEGESFLLLPTGPKLMLGAAVIEPS